MLEIRSRSLNSSHFMRCLLGELRIVTAYRVARSDSYGSSHKCSLTKASNLFLANRLVHDSRRGVSRPALRRTEGPPEGFVVRCRSRIAAPAPIDGPASPFGGDQRGRFCSPSSDRKHRKQWTDGGLETSSRSIILALCRPIVFLRSGSLCFSTRNPGTNSSDRFVRHGWVSFVKNRVDGKAPR